MADLLELELPVGLRAKSVLVKYCSTVPDVVKANVVKFNNRLVAKGLVDEGVYDPQNRIYTSLESASTLYQACMTTVERDPSKFSTLMGVLIEYPLLRNAVKEMRVEAVQAKLMDQKLESVAQEVPHGGAQEVPHGGAQQSQEGRCIEVDGGDASRPAHPSTEGRSTGYDGGDASRPARTSTEDQENKCPSKCTIGCSLPCFTISGPVEEVCPCIKKLSPKMKIAILVIIIIGAVLVFLFSLLATLLSVFNIF